MQTEPKQMDILALAFLGDAVYEQFVRARILRLEGAKRADLLHRRAVSYVCAGAQARAVKHLAEQGILTEEETAFARRAHNHRTATKPKNADPVDYKWATAFEALLGRLFLEENTQRLMLIMESAAVLSEEINVRPEP